MTEAIAYVYSCSVVHSNLRPKNILVHKTSPGSRDLLLCDFRGSTYVELVLDGDCFPNGTFYHPTFELKSTPNLDIFGLGSLFYTILTGNWPYRTSSESPQTIDERIIYKKEVSEAFNQEKYFDLTRVVGGSEILVCSEK